MADTLSKAIDGLNRRYLLDHPGDAARYLEDLSADAAASALAAQPAQTLVPVWRRLIPTRAALLLTNLPDVLASAILAELLPNEALRILGQLDPTVRERYLALMEAPVRDKLQTLMQYPADSAGRLMDTRVAIFRGGASAAEALDVLRQFGASESDSIFIVDDDENRLASMILIRDLAVADPTAALESIAVDPPATVHAVAPQRDVTEAFERTRIDDLPVIDADSVLLGVIHSSAVVQAIHENATADIQKMVGASKDERALSSSIFAVRKRLPWLQINLLTAFMAAAVVGLFEDTIARFTALAVLLPVVAGQSGNAGAQALAVTMRGLALREITVRQWLAVTVKEVNVGLMNGIAVAVTCGIGVFVWSGSYGLVLVIAMAMVLAMIAAGFAGAVVPIVLTRLGQDPAQSSSIVLTTVTDIAGFFAFLGIATLLANMI